MEYVIDESDTGRQRLLAHFLNRLTEPHLARLAPTRSGRWLDVGCGIGETTKMLTRFMSHDGECIGIDGNPALLEIARSQEWLGGRVSFQQSDATNLPFDNDSFDFVFVRSVLVHLQHPVNAIREMLRVVRPGGLVFAQEPDFSFSCCYPSSIAYERLTEMCAPVFPDSQIGRKLVHLFREAGAKSPSARADTFMEYDSTELKRFHRMTFAAIGPALVRADRVTESEFNALLSDFRRVEHDPSIVVLGYPVVSAWTYS